ncbi:YccS family putative transporter [Frateuria defendens]|uniref:YccS family putative transporter n=1 Tax=Frateuria defendens TaxID=2219559 RepID=UPI00069F3231|nr:YccS family putative transporter [Frateuria defendens]
MRFPLAPHPFARLLASDRSADVLRVALALGGAAVYCVAAGQLHILITLLLGAIACALAETDESWRGRLGSLAVTLVCFALAAVVVELIFGRPWLFAAVLPLATFALVMLGAASGRYASIATATLILAIYTMIGMEVDTGPRNLLDEPLLLLVGALWYGLLSLAWSVLAPQNAVRHALANVFEALAGQIEAKAALLEPVRDTDHEAIRVGLAQWNARVVAALNETRRALLDRLGRRRPRGDTEEQLRLYFMAQDLHERVHSSHYPYKELAEAFFHSDLLFRCCRLLKLQAAALRRRARALRERKRMPVNDQARTALADARAALAHRRQQVPAPPAHLLDAVEALLRNVIALQDRLGRRRAPQPYGQDQALLDPNPHSLGEAFARIRAQCTPRSLHFRHAVRLAVGMLAGYLALLVTHPQHGYWTLLTTLLVCLPGYGATRRRLVQRVAGTVIGLVAGWAMLQLMPDRLLQLPLLVVSGSAFFALRYRYYTAATAVVTLFVVLCFDQITSGYEVLGPRLVDTVVGAAIAALMLRFVLPDWRVRHLRERLADVLASDARYLAGIARQYRSGREDDVPYRDVRRDAHNAHAALSGAIRDMLEEPGHTRDYTDHALRTLGVAHDLLSYLSALGAHRQGGVFAGDDPLEERGAALAQHIEALAAALRAGRAAHFAPRAAPAAPTPEHDEAHRLIAAQYAQIESACARLAELGPAL